MLWCKKYNSPKGLLLAISDEDLLGKTFEEGDFCLTVNDFYRGDLLENEAISVLFDAAVIINAVGKNAVKLLLGAGLGSDEFVKRIEGIPHLQVFKITS